MSLQANLVGLRRQNTEAYIEQHRGRREFVQVSPDYMAVDINASAM